MSKTMSKLEERMREVFLKRDVIIHYDGYKWWAHDCLKDTDSILYSHEFFENLIEGVDEHLNKQKNGGRRVGKNDGN